MKCLEKTNLSTGTENGGRSQQSANNNGIFSFFPSSGLDHNNVDGFAISYKDSTATLKPKYERQTGTNSFLLESTTVAGVHLLSFEFGAGTGGIYVDGSNAFSDTFAPFPTTVNPATFVIGGRPATGGFYSLTDYAEILIYNTKLSTGNRESIECYLKARYNLTSVSNSSCG